MAQEVHTLFYASFLRQSGGHFMAQTCWKNAFCVQKVPTGAYSFFYVPNGFIKSYYLQHNVPTPFNKTKPI